ncbi:MAG: RNA polymerase sigma factor SigJ [Candidatus Nanopelagicales bacterium]
MSDTAAHPLDDGERRRLLSLAYRMTGTLSDAEDVVQEAYVRWYRLPDDERAAISAPAAWFTRVGSRIALDHLTSARVRREHYVGPWLPEPVPADLFAGTAPRGPSLVAAAPAEADPADRVTLDDAVSAALLVVLESMTPAERVAFVLHDVFGLPFAEVAQIVGRSVDSTRQLAASGRRHVRQERAVAVPRAEHDVVVRAFLAAASTGDVHALVRLLAPDAELRSDGGGVVSAALNVIQGADRVARFVLGILAKNPGVAVREVRTADGAGFRLDVGDQVIGLVTFGVVDQAITDVWLVRNPAKLGAWRGEPVGG